MNATNDFVDIRYQQSGQSTNTDSLGMREMQAKAYEARNKRYLLIKAPPASGKSRALMYIALDKLENQGIGRWWWLYQRRALAGRLIIPIW